ncbi:cysteine-rich secretory protein LCCL domain-containing 1-like [Mytilus trossulus]|uniref:cysteine-rich secretory protein LCCL domain-containing 1-like n=1 Tax=Mytilus trossulus TaxID=6551 RepID=UPI0030061F9F
MHKLLKVFFVQLILFYVCTFSRKIGRSVKLTHRDKLMIVNYHNDIRRLIYASNMQALSWDHAAAEKAREWGHNCIFNRLWDDNYGENLYKTYFTKATRSREVMMDALKDWDKERQNLFSWDVKCTESETCNYKQLVSAKSDSVGCALIKCPRMIESKKTTNYNMNYFICFYSPKVELDKQPFTYGRKCSACPQGYHCKRKMCTKKKWKKIKHSGNVIKKKLPERNLNIPTTNIIIREDSRGYTHHRNTSNDQTNVLLPIPPAALTGREASEKVFNGGNTEIKITPRRRRMKRQSSRRYSSYDDYLRRDRLRRERQRAQQLYEREQLRRQREEQAAHQRRNARPSADIRRRPNTQTERRQPQRNTAPGESWHACLL